MSDDFRLGLIVGGAIAVVAALVWRFVVLHRRRSSVARGLEASDPQDRARAGITLVDEGLQRSARPLLAHVARERDDRVCYAIALAVVRRQWEPVDTTQVTQLREWASLELEQRGQPVHAFGPAVTRPSDMGGPRPPHPEGGTPPPPPRPEPAAGETPPRPKDGVSWHAPDAGETE
jgi:hypothetical protein